MKLLTMRLLYELPVAIYINAAKTISTVIVTANPIVAANNEVNFNILMKPTTMHRQMTSLIIILPLPYHQPTNNPAARHRLSNYRIRN